MIMVEKRNDAMLLLLNVEVLMKTPLIEAKFFPRYRCRGSIIFI